MRIIFRLLLAAGLMVLALPGYAGSTIQTFLCEIDDDVHEEQIEMPIDSGNDDSGDDCVPAHATKRICDFELRPRQTSCPA